MRQTAAAAIFRGHILLRCSYLAQYEHVLALLVCDPVYGLFRVRRLVHPLQVLLQDLLVKGDLLVGTSMTFAEVKNSRGEG